MLVVRALYDLKSSCVAFRVFLAESLYDLGYKSSVADPDVWLRPDIKEREIVSSNGNAFYFMWKIYCA